MLTRVLPSSPSARPTDFDFLKVIGKGNYGKVSNMVKVESLGLPFSSLLHPVPIACMCKEGAHNLQIQGCRAGAGAIRGVVTCGTLHFCFRSGPPGQAQVRRDVLCSEGAAEKVHLKE